MKQFVKLALPFALGVIVTLIVVIPQWGGATPEPADTTPPIDIQAAIKDAVDAAVMEVLASPTVEAEYLSAEIEPEPAEDEEEPEQEAEETPEPEPTPAPTPKVQPSPSPKPQTSEPEYFYEDGNKYAIINGHKTYIAGDDEPAASSETYDWENDPLKDVPGGFN